MRLFLKEFALKKNFIKCLLLVMACQIFNQSAGATECTPINAVSCIYNLYDINSATEYISETLLGNKDAFPEYQTKSQHHKSQFLKQGGSVKIFQQQFLVCSLKEFVTVVSFAYPLDETYSFLFSKDITPPPPKA